MITKTTDISTLLASDIAKLTTQEISNLTRTQQENFTAEQVSGLTDKLLAVLPAKYIPADVFAGISINAIPSLAIKSLTAGQFAALTPNQVQALTSSQVSELTKVQLSQVSSDNFGALSFSSGKTAGGLNGINIKLLNNEQLSYLTTDQIAALSNNQFSQFSSSQLKSLSNEQYSALTSLQASALKSFSGFTNDAIAALSNSFISAVQPQAFSTLTKEQLASFIPEQMIAINSKQLASLSLTKIAAFEGEDVSALLPSTLSGLTKVNIGGLTLSNLTNEQFNVLASEQITALNTAQINQLNSDNAAWLTPLMIKSFSPAQIKALPLEAIAAIDSHSIAALTAKNILGLNTAEGSNQIAALSIEQLSALSSVAVKVLTPSQIEALSVDAVLALPPNIINAVSTSAFPLINSIAFSKLEPNQVAALSTAQIGVMTTKQISQLGFDQAGALLPTQIKKLADEVKYLSNEAISGLDPKVIKNVDFSVLTKEQISQFTSEQAINFQSNQLSKLSPTTITGLLAGQIEVMSPYAFKGIDINVMPYLSTAAVEALQPNQLSKFSSNQLEALSPKQVGYLSSDILETWLPNKGFSSILNNDSVSGGIETSHTIIGSNLADRITASKGNDIILSNGGIDSINAGAGNDTIILINSNAKIDGTIAGGEGVDKLVLTIKRDMDNSIKDPEFANISDIEILQLTDRNVINLGANAYNAGIKKVITGDGKTAVTASYDIVIDAAGMGANMLYVWGTGDVIASTSNLSREINGAASSGNLSLTGGFQTTYIAGGSGNDKVNAVASNSSVMISGGDGSDTLTGGSVADIFVFSSTASKISTNCDIVTNYVGDVDMLQFNLPNSNLPSLVTLPSINNSAPISGTSVQVNNRGLLTFHGSDNTYNKKIAALENDIGLDSPNQVALFTLGSDSYVYYSGALIGNSDDQVVKLSTLIGTGIKLDTTGKVITVSISNTTPTVLSSLFSITGDSKTLEGEITNFYINLVNRTPGDYSVKTTLTALGGATWEVGSAEGTDFVNTLTLDKASSDAGITFNPTTGILNIPATSQVTTATLSTLIKSDTISPETGEKVELSLSDAMGSNVIINAAAPAAITSIIDQPISGLIFSNGIIAPPPLGGTYGGQIRSSVLQTNGKILVAGMGKRPVFGQNSDIVLVRYNIDGSLDTNFDFDGKVNTTLSETYDEAYAVALQTDGKILVTGIKDSNTSPSPLVILRYNPDGSLDSTFGDNGLTSTHISTQDIGMDISIQTDNKIIVLGSSNALGLELLRFNSDGLLDNSFNDDGIVTIGSGKFGSAVVLQPDGKILVTGSIDMKTQTQISDSSFFRLHDSLLVRFNSDGSLDSSFGDQGIVITHLADGAGSYGGSIVLLNDGKILVVGGAYYSTLTSDNVPNNVPKVNGISVYTISNQFTLTRYNSDGSIDNNFGTLGTIKTLVGSVGSNATSVAIQADGKILVCGSSMLDNPFMNDFAVARYNTDGSLDTTFDNDGMVTTRIGGMASASSIIVQNDGKIVVSGTGYNGGQVFALVRYNTDGSLDSTFNSSSPSASPAAITVSGQADASQDNLAFNFALGNYEYTIKGFGSGDSLNFSGNTTPAIINIDASDGVVDVQWAYTGNVVSIHLTGLTSAQDSAIFGSLSFNNVFGLGSIGLSF